MKLRTALSFLLLVNSILLSSLGSSLLTTLPSWQSGEMRFSIQESRKEKLHESYTIDAAALAVEAIRILVEPSLWQNTTLREAIIEYQTDLNQSGFQARLYTEAVATVEALRALFQGWYASEELVGAVLIGSFPKAFFHHEVLPDTYPADTFICDLFLTDLDGVWSDTNPVDGIYDSHTGEIHPEIYLGRIDPSSRTLGNLSVEEELYRYLKRCHAYRHRELTRQHKALTFIDDDWESWADGTYANWPNWLASTYPKRTDIYDPYQTCKVGWQAELVKNYEWVHLCAHSNATAHFFAGITSWEIITSKEINAIRPSFHFYNLYCCHGAAWEYPDSLAITYLFASDYSLVVVASTKTGGMLAGNNFYYWLGENKTIGYALYQWFQNVESYISYYLEFFYGMCILGDPFLTNDIDCTVLKPEIFSTTHPDPTEKYLKTRPAFVWTEPRDAHQIVGYYYILDQQPMTVVTKENGTFLTTTFLKITQGLANGTWYLHLVAEDSLGNVGKNTAHFKINVNRVALRAIVLSVSLGMTGVIVFAAVFNSIRKRAL